MKNWVSAFAARSDPTHHHERRHHGFGADRLDAVLRLDHDRHVITVVSQTFEPWCLNHLGWNQLAVTVEQEPLVVGRKAVVTGREDEVAERPTAVEQR